MEAPEAKGFLRRARWQVSSITSEPKHCQHLTPYRLDSRSQNPEEAEQLFSSVGGSRSFGTEERSCPKKGGLGCKLNQVDISNPVPASGAASWHWEGACGGSGPGCSTAFQGSCSALPPGHSGLQEKQGQHLTVSAASAMWGLRFRRPEFGSSSCVVFSGQAKELTAVENYLPAEILQGCCLDCLIHNCTLNKVRGEAASSVDLIRLMEADMIYT